MKNFIILTAVNDKSFAIDIDRIDSINEAYDSDVGGYTRINIINSNTYWRVKDSVEEIVKRINEVNNNINK